MPYPSATAVEIDRKLREDFRKRLKEYGVNADVTDPMLAVLFRTFAQQLEVLYSDTERIRLALLDELVGGLGLEKRMARPAQAVIQFSGTNANLLIEAGSALTGETGLGAKLTFTTDSTIQVSNARLSFGATYEDGMLRLMPGIEMPERLANARPSLEPIKTNLGPHPAVYLAIDLPSQGTISGHSFHFDLTPDAREIQKALEQETWCLCSTNGEFSAQGILRPAAGNAGVRQLRWLIRPGNVEEGAEPRAEVATLPSGFYGGKIYVLPVIPQERKLTCRFPRGMEAALTRLFGRETQNIFNAERVWVKITLPKGLPALHTAISCVGMHAVTASNVECLNQTVYFAKHGTSIPISKDGGTSWHLVAPLAVIGESDTPYLGQTEPSTDANVGRYVVRNGRIEITPALWPNGKAHTYANIRVWITSGEAGNQVGPGKITSIQTSDLASLRVTNVTSAAGGTGSEEYAEAQSRFAFALLSRDRVVTRADLYAAVKSFDRRVADVTIRSGLERAQGALRRIERVTLHLRRDEFTDPDVEVRYLVEDLRNALDRRFLHDIELRVDVEWEAE